MPPCLRKGASIGEDAVWMGNGINVFSRLLLDPTVVKTCQNERCVKVPAKTAAGPPEAARVEWASAQLNLGKLAAMGGLLTPPYTIRFICLTARMLYICGGLYRADA
jgi:hypothetical protein